MFVRVAVGVLEAERVPVADRVVVRVSDEVRVNVAERVPEEVEVRDKDHDEAEDTDVTCTRRRTRASVGALETANDTPYRGGDVSRVCEGTEPQTSTMNFDTGSSPKIEIEEILRAFFDCTDSECATPVSRYTVPVSILVSLYHRRELRWSPLSTPLAFATSILHCSPLQRCPSLSCSAVTLRLDTTTARPGGRRVGV